MDSHLFCPSICEKTVRDWKNTQHRSCLPVRYMHTKGKIKARKEKQNRTDGMINAKLLVVSPK